MSKKPISIPSSSATTHISPSLRNALYSALLSGDGIRNIETTLDRQLAESGFKDELRRYVTDLFRSGQATTAEEARSLAMEMIKQQSNGGAQTNGTNGLNGVNGDHAEEYELKIPEKAVAEGARSVRRELERVCEITED